MNQKKVCDSLDNGIVQSFYRIGVYESSSKTWDVNFEAFKDRGVVVIWDQKDKLCGWSRYNYEEYKKYKRGKGTSLMIDKIKKLDAVYLDSYKVMVKIKKENMKPSLCKPGLMESLKGIPSSVEVDVEESVESKIMKVEEKPTKMMRDKPRIEETV